MSVKTFEKLTALLDKHQARYRVVEHPTAGKSEEVAKNSWYRIRARCKGVSMQSKRKWRKTSGISDIAG